MKKLIFLIVTILLVSTHVFCATKVIIIQKTGGGPNGYHTVYEVHNGNQHQLACQDPGYEVCDWSVKPQVQGPNSIVSWDDLETHANQQVINGNSIGTYTNNVYINGDFWNRSVQWNGTDTCNLQVDINIQLVTYPN